MYISNEMRELKYQTETQIKKVMWKAGLDRLDAESVVLHNDLQGNKFARRWGVGQDNIGERLMAPLQSDQVTGFVDSYWS